MRECVGERKREREKREGVLVSEGKWSSGSAEKESWWWRGMNRLGIEERQTRRR